MKLTSILSLAVLGLMSACAASTEAPNESNEGSTSQAICGNGVRPGCGDCAYDPSSPKGGYRTCWTCDGDSYRQACFATQSILWSGHVWIWTSHGPSNADFSVKVRFQKSGGTEQMIIDEMTLPLGVTLSLPAGQQAIGTISGDSAKLTLPLHGSAYGQNIDVVLPLTTDATIAPPNAPVNTVGHHDPNSGLFQMVGHQGSYGGDYFDAFFSGKITSWP